MPPSGFNRPAVAGALLFAEAFYKDLLQEMQSGKYASYEEAIEQELKQIKGVLEKLHINEQGELVERT